MTAKRKIPASDVVVANRTLEGVLADMAERMAQNSERIAQNSEQIRASNEATNERFAIVHAEIEKMTSGIYALAVKMDERLRALEKRAT